MPKPLRLPRRRGFFRGTGGELFLFLCSTGRLSSPDGSVRAPPPDLRAAGFLRSVNSVVSSLPSPIFVKSGGGTVGETAPRLSTRRYLLPMRGETYLRNAARAADPSVVSPSPWDSGPLVDGGWRNCCRSDLHAPHPLLVVGRRLTSEPVSTHLRTLRSVSQRERGAANRLGGWLNEQKA